MLNENGSPIVGNETNMLGVRVPPHPRADVKPDQNGMVQTGMGGMSVSPGWRDLPPFLIPSRLGKLAPGARGSNKLTCFRFGEGSFGNAPVTQSLTLVVNRPTHGTVQPSRSMPITEFQKQLADTQAAWVIDEE
jgi:hypothetical protein